MTKATDDLNAVENDIQQEEQQLALLQEQLDNAIAQITANKKQHTLDLLRTAGNFCNDNPPAKNLNVSLPVIYTDIIGTTELASLFTAFTNAGKFIVINTMNGIVSNQ